MPPTRALCSLLRKIERLPITMKRGYIIGLIICYILAIAAIAISCIRCAPFQIDIVAVLANILALMVTILLGIIAYNYFIQKSDVQKFKSEVQRLIDKETTDVYLTMMTSFSASKDYVSLFTIGHAVLSRMEGCSDKDITMICSILNLCLVQMSNEEKERHLIKTNSEKLLAVLEKYKTNVAAMQLWQTMSNE